MWLVMGEVIVVLFLLSGAASPILFWAPGLGEIILILFFVGGVTVVFAAFYFLAKYSTGIGGKTCPYCAEKIRSAAKICRYCQRDVTGV